MPFKPFNYGDTIAQAQGINNLRSRNALMKQELDPDSMQNQLRAAQIRQLQAQAANPGGARLGQINPRDFTAESISAYQKSGNMRDLVRYNQPRQPIRVDTGDGVEIWTIDPATRQPVLIKRLDKKVPVDQTPDHKAAVETAVKEAETDALVDRQYELDDVDSVLKSQNQLGVMLTQNQKLDQVIKLSKNGANTGPLMQYLPTMRAQTVKMENLQRSMGLDIVGAVTFGALSKGELDLALNTAIPTNLSGPALVKWARDKQAANDKLAKYYLEQVKFIRGGGTQAEWLDKVNTAGGINSSIGAIEEGADFSGKGDETYEQRRARILGQ